MTKLRAGYDVVVVGGGTAGSIATIAAARTGARTLVIEQHGSIGGVLGLGMNLLGPVDGEGFWALGGIGREALERARELGGVHGPSRNPSVASSLTQDPEILKLTLLEMMLESDAELLLHTMLVGVETEAERVSRLTIANKGGIEHVEMATVVDSSGDADVVARAGGPWVFGREPDGLAQPASRLCRVGNVDINRVWNYLEQHPEDRTGSQQPGSPPRPPYPMEFIRNTPGVSISGFGAVIERARESGDFDLPRSGMILYTYPGRPEVGINITRVHEVDGSDPDDLTRGEIVTQRQLLVALRFLRAYVPGFEDAYISSVPHQLGVRESRHIQGAYVLTGHDVLSGRSFEDQIGRCAYPFTIHDVKPGAEQSGRVVSGGGTTMHRIDRSFGIPLRCLIPVGMANVAVAGRSISADHEAAASIRGQTGCMVTGHAAGVVAALGAGHGRTLAELEASEVQAILVGQGALLERSVRFVDHESVTTGSST